MSCTGKPNQCNSRGSLFTCCGQATFSNVEHSLTQPDQQEPAVPERLLTAPALNATCSRLLEKVTLLQMPQKEFPQHFGQVPSPSCTTPASSAKGRDSLPHASHSPH